jgi:hypothetical protein
MGFIRERISAPSTPHAHTTAGRLYAGDEFVMLDSDVTLSAKELFQAWFVPGDDAPEIEGVLSQESVGFDTSVGDVSLTFPSAAAFNAHLLLTLARSPAGFSLEKIRDQVHSFWLDGQDVGNQRDRTSTHFYNYGGANDAFIKPGSGMVFKTHDGSTTNTPLSGLNVKIDAATPMVKSKAHGLNHHDPNTKKHSAGQFRITGISPANGGTANPSETDKVEFFFSKAHPWTRFVPLFFSCVSFNKNNMGLGYASEIPRQLAKGRASGNSGGSAGNGDWWVKGTVAAPLHIAESVSAPVDDILDIGIEVMLVYPQIQDEKLDIWMQMRKVDPKNGSISASFARVYTSATNIQHIEDFRF